MYFIPITLMLLHLNFPTGIEKSLSYLILLHTHSHSHTHTHTHGMLYALFPAVPKLPDAVMGRPGLSVSLSAVMGRPGVSVSLSAVMGRRGLSLSLSVLCISLSLSHSHT